MAILNDSQFARTINANGGGSRMLHTGEAVELGTPNTWSVSFQGYEKKASRPVTAAEVVRHRQWLQSHEELRSNPLVIHGGWQPVEAKKPTYLDASQRIEGRRNAVVTGRRHHQIAGFGLERGRDLYLGTRRPDRQLVVDPESRAVVQKTYQGDRRLGFEEVTAPVSGRGRQRAARNANADRKRSAALAEVKQVNRRRRPL